MNKLRAQLRAHKIVTAVMGFLLIASFAVVGVKAITMTPDELKEFLPQPLPEENLGAVSGTDHYVAERFWAGFGGNVLATSTSGTATTLDENTLAKYTAIEMTPNIASFTYTLPATSTLSSLLKNIGDTQTWIWQNATSTTATTITLAAGTGWNLSGVDANVDVFPGAAYTARELVIMDCYRQSNKDINCELRENIAAD